MPAKTCILSHQRRLKMQADKAHVCVRLLSLSDAMGPSSEQVATQEELVHAATALSQAAPLPGPLADLRLQNGDIDALRMLWAQVIAPLRPETYWQLICTALCCHRICVFGICS